MFRSTPTSPRRASRAMTLIEVLLAVLLLSLTIGIVMTAVTSMAAMETNGRKRLAAYEVANRIMLQYLDDAKALPSKSLAIEYGDKKFFWELDETPTIMVINHKQESGGANLQALDRFRLICVHVYEADREGNHEIRGEPLAFITRVIDPYAPRNPDSIETFTSDPSKITDMIQGLLGGARVPGDASRLQGRQLK